MLSTNGGEFLRDKHGLPICGASWPSRPIAWARGGSLGRISADAARILSHFSDKTDKRCMVDATSVPYSVVLSGQREDGGKDGGRFGCRLTGIG